MRRPNRHISKQKQIRILKKMIRNQDATLSLYRKEMPEAFHEIQRLKGKLFAAEREIQYQKGTNEIQDRMADRRRAYQSGAQDNDL